MTVGEALRLISEFVIFTDYNREIFEYDRNHPALGYKIDSLDYKRASLNRYIFTFDSCDTGSDFYMESHTGFSYAEELLVDNVISSINKFINVLSYNELYLILKSIRLDTLLQAVCKVIDGKRFCMIDADTRKLLIRHIMKMDDWSCQTYENEPISFSLGIDLCTNETSDVKISDLYNDAMLKALSSGKNTIIVCNKRGEILKYEKLAKSYRDNTPLAWGTIAEWSKWGIAVSLTSDREILVFYDQAFLYIKRVGKWYPANSSPLYYRMLEAAGYNKEMKTALINTCYDASFRRCGACIGIVDDDCPLIYNIDKYRTSNTPRALFFRQIMGNKKFQEIDREIRQELVGIDGATILDKEGNVLAIGAILKIETSGFQRRTTGGRSVAAQQLAQYGIGIKISVDGSIEAWKKNAAGLLEKFLEVI